MKRVERYLVRRNLDTYAEIVFARYLEKKGIVPYFPYKDVGIDMIGLRGRRVDLYQLKARNEMRGMPGDYWFPLRKNIEGLSKLCGRIFFVLCALQPNKEDFHFFKFPISVAVRYFKSKHVRRQLRGTVGRPSYPAI